MNRANETNELKKKKGFQTHLRTTSQKFEFTKKFKGTVVVTIVVAEALEPFHSNRK